MNQEALLKLVSQTMPYGKYKGRILADLPGNYLNWFAREGFPPGELGRLLALMHELDHNGLSGLLAPLRSNPRSIPTVRGRWRDPPAQSPSHEPNDLVGRRLVYPIRGCSKALPVSDKLTLREHANRWMG